MSSFVFDLGLQMSTARVWVAVDVSAEWMDHALPDAGTVRRAGQN
jgi:hypothetical protein